MIEHVALDVEIQSILDQTRSPASFSIQKSSPIDSIFSRT
jgi:hypothetical protein